MKDQTEKNLIQKTENALKKSKVRNLIFMGLILMILMISSATTYHLIHRSTENALTLYKSPFTVSSSSSDLIGLLQNVRDNHYEMLQNQTLGNQIDYVNSLRDYLQNSDSLIQIIQKRYLGDEVQIVRLIKNHVQVTTSINEVLRLNTTNEDYYKSLVAYATTIHKKLQDHMDNISFIHNYAANKARSLFLQSEELNRNAELTIVLLLMGSILLVITIAIISQQQLIFHNNNLNKWIRKTKEGEELFRIVFEHSPVGKSMTGIDGSLNVNQSFAQMLGYSKEELLLKNWSEITHPDDIESSADIVKEMVSGKRDVAYFEKRYFHKDGHIIWTDIATHLLRDNEGKPRFFVTHISDITDKKQQDKIKELQVENLTRSNDELMNFAYIASHDLQEPLRMVASYTQMIEHKYSDILDEKGRQYLNFATNGAQRMQILINDLLQYSRVNTNQDQVSVIDTKSMLKRIIQTLDDYIKENKAVVEVIHAPAIMGINSLIERLFTNLIGNALKYRSEEDPRIKIDCTDSETHHKFSVQDNGIGIDEKFQNKVFGIFQRLHGRDKYQGTGIGLSVCKRIVSRHNGEIWFESDGKTGTTFYFSIVKKPL